MLTILDATVELALGPSWYQREKKYELAKGHPERAAWAARGVSQVDDRITVVR